MIRELPIIFNTDMVRAILDGRKKVTRRICKDGNEYTIPDMGFYDPNKRTYAVHSFADQAHTDKLSIAERTCPICPEDILYVRETWCSGYDGEVYFYLADKNTEREQKQLIDYDDRRWCPSIHMPKQAARIWLKVTDVRVERLQDITNDQILKEGISKETVNHFMTQFQEATEQLVRAAHFLPFSDLWNSTIKKDFYLNSWNANPWVWVIEFERCGKPESAI